jgi:serine/threonine protein kinase
MSIPQFLQEKFDSVDPIDGGNGSGVYKCTLESRVTAVKVFKAVAPGLREMFLREVELIRSVAHENIVKIFDAGQLDGFCWYEMEYANQGSLAGMHGYLIYSDVERVGYFRRICLGVAALHQSDPPIIHGDLKPSNVLVFEIVGSDRPCALKIADFGAARVAGDHKKEMALGTAHYMAPERLRDPLIATVVSDIYSLGILLLDMCTGQNSPTEANLARVPQLLLPVVQKMIAERPQERYQSVCEVIAALDSFSPGLLMFGREIKSGETPFVWHSNVGRKVENAFGALGTCDVGNALERLLLFEEGLDLLGSASDDVASWIKNLPGSVVATIEEADRKAGSSGAAGLRLVQRFLDAAGQTRSTDYYAPMPDAWSRFLADVFHSSQFRATKNVCLLGLASFLDRFGTEWTRYYLGGTICNLQDPSYAIEMAECLRRIGREDIAVLLDGVPDQRDLDVPALRAALKLG